MNGKPILEKGRGSVQTAGAAIRSCIGRFVNTFRGNRKWRDSGCTQGDGSARSQATVRNVDRHRVRLLE